MEDEASGTVQLLASVNKASLRWRGQYADISIVLHFGISIARWLVSVRANPQKAGPRNPSETAEPPSWTAPHQLSVPDFTGSGVPISKPRWFGHGGQRPPGGR